jgi:nicotinate-nucleotide pyrophosphorylase (carboxylating)
MPKSVRRLILDALEEDIGQEDVTTNSTVPETARCRARLTAKQAGVLSGINVFRAVFDCTKADIADWQSFSDGDAFAPGDCVASFEGNARGVLTGERVAMNFAGHLSGVATLTSRYVAAVAGLDVRICDTRKTIPLLRQLEKQAVVHGGGSNHRHTLFHGILIKENHIMAAGGITAAITKARQAAPHLLKIEVEVTNLNEFDEAITAGADAILLDNMSRELMREAVARVNGARIMLEASGNVRLDTVRAIAETGIHVISVGSLTHSAPTADLSLLIENIA